METKKLSLEEMEGVEGGAKGCGLAIFTLGVSIIGASAALVTLNPLGVALGVAGIYGGGPGMLIACELI